MAGTRNKYEEFQDNSSHRILANYLKRFIGYIRGKRWRSWLRHCATSRKVAGSIPDGVIGIFHGHNSSGHTMAVGVNSASNRNNYQECFLGIKAVGAYGGQPYHLQVPTVLKSGSLNLLEPLRPVQGCNGMALHLPLTFHSIYTKKSCCYHAKINIEGFILPTI
jgi:hypothetical protein